MSYKPGQIIKINTGPDAGERAMVIEERNGVVLASKSFHRWSYRGYTPDEVEEAEPLPVKTGYDLKEHFGPVISGLVPVPNFERVLDIHKFLYSFTACAGIEIIPGGPHEAMLPQFEFRPQHARYFINYGQWKGPTGEGYVMVSGGYGKPVEVGRFALCKHEHVQGANANPMRGWHPGHCAKCGLDMSVDSSD